MSLPRLIVTAITTLDPGAAPATSVTPHASHSAWLPCKGGALLPDWQRQMRLLNHHTGRVLGSGSCDGAVRHLCRQSASCKPTSTLLFRVFLPPLFY